jgi:hypothetical protein
MSESPATSKLSASSRLAANPILIGLFLCGLIVVSFYLRTRSIRASFWMDEALSVGISSHPILDIPQVLKRDGSPPLYYMTLAAWMGAFGRTEAATHALSLLFALVAIPVGTWSGWRLFGKRAGIYMAVLVAVSVFLTTYAEETRMYTLIALLSLVTASAFCLVFVLRRRGWLPLFSIALAAMLYTHGWGIFFGLSCGIAWLWLVQQAGEKKPLLKDGLIGFGITALLFLPWVPTLLFQAAHTGAPWSSKPRLGVVAQIATLLGGWATAAALTVGAIVGLAVILKRQPNPDRDVTPPSQTRASLVSIAIMVVGTLAIAWTLSQFNPAWANRYMAAIICPLLLFLSAGLARSKWAGVLGVAAAVALALVSPVDNTLRVKSDQRDIAANVRNDLRPGDLVISGQPEQTPLAWYYMPGGLQFADPMGKTSDPRMLDWVDVVDRMNAAPTVPTYTKLVGSMPKGSRILMIRPLTITRSNWTQSWTSLIRLRSAQWSGQLARDPRLVELKAVPWFFISPSGVGNSAVLYEKRS